MHNVTGWNVITIGHRRRGRGAEVYVTVSFAYVNMREGLSVVSLYWRSNNKREIQKHCLPIQCDK
jgi:hypothetical protein